DKHGNVAERGEMVLCTVTSKREFFETTEQEFMKRGWLANIPQTLPEQRWSAASIRSYVEGTSQAPDLWALYQALRSKFEWYIDFDNEAHGPTICAVYALASYFFFLFEYFPYLKLGGEKGVGKTKTGSVFECLCFNAEIFAETSAAAIYRTTQDTRGTMVIDEGEGLADKNDEQIAYFSVLNSGWQKNGKATKVSQDGDKLRVTKFSTYCPKVICSINGLEEVLGDRAFEIILFRTLDREKANREVSEDSAEWKAIRDQEYLSLFGHWDELRDLIPTVTNPFDFSGRIWNLAKPLVSVARLVDAHRPAGSPSVEQEVAAFIEQQAKEKEAKGAESFGTTVLLMLKQIVDTEGRSTLTAPSLDHSLRIDLNALTSKVREAEGSEKLSHKEVAKALRNMRLYNEPRRDGPQGGTRFGVTQAQLEAATTRAFGRRFPTEGTEATEGTEGQKEGLCELCGKPGTLSKSPAGDFACTVCLKDLGGEGLDPSSQTRAPAMPNSETVPGPEQHDSRSGSEQGEKRGVDSQGTPTPPATKLLPWRCYKCGDEMVDAKGEADFSYNVFLKGKGHLCRKCPAEISRAPRDDDDFHRPDGSEAETA
nr:hypothetical protein [Nitrososphaerota archaeon]